MKQGVPLLSFLLRAAPRRGTALVHPFGIALSPVPGRIPTGFVPRWFSSSSSAPRVSIKFGVAVCVPQKPSATRVGVVVQRSTDFEVDDDDFDDGASKKLPQLITDMKPAVHRNLHYDAVREFEVRDGLVITAQGATAVDTGVFTGRSPKDKYVVEDVPDVWWGPVNRPMRRAVFDELTIKVLSHLGNSGEIFVYDGYAGIAADPPLAIRVVTSKAWQHHFCKNMFVEATTQQGHKKKKKQFSPDYTVYVAPDFKDLEFERHGLRSETFIAFDLGAAGTRTALVGGTEYGGEIKKGIFTVMNYLKPRYQRVLTMHCAANIGKRHDDVALFFGLSGTGKTTLSTDPSRLLLGDDEHGWDDRGVWNLEGGCYAKTLDLDPVKEPQIYAAIKRNALLENVKVNEKNEVDYASRDKTENARVSYPLDHISKSAPPTTRAPHPSRIFFLACDAFGVLPPVAKLSVEQAMYHFLSGFTAKVAGTERGLRPDAPTPTFSACFGAAFLPLHPTRYAKLLGEKMRSHNVTAYLINTGWAGGPAVVSGKKNELNKQRQGQRMPLSLTRALVAAVLRGDLDHDDTTFHPVLNLEVPNSLKTRDGARNPALSTVDVLHPWASWPSRDDYERAAADLATLFVDNFRQYADYKGDCKDEYNDDDDKFGFDSGFDFSAYGPQPPPS